jgi:hypothetical protein
MCSAARPGRQREAEVTTLPAKPSRNSVLAAAFPDVDTANLPDTFAKFIRVDAPVPDTYEVYEGVSYQWVDGVVKDVHTVRPMTDEERAAKDAEITDAANQLRLARIAFINDTLTTETDETAQTLWLNCLTAHEAWVLESVDPITPSFPRFPIKDESGSWVAPVS